jgi:hypothetical protein
VLYSLIVNAFFIEHYQDEFKYSEKMNILTSDLGDPWLSSLVLFSKRLASLRRMENAEASRLAEKHLETYRRFGNRFGMPTPLISRGHSELAAGNFEQTKGYYKQCIAIA